MDSCSSYKGSLFIVAGEKDFSCKHAYKYIEKSAALKKKLLVIDDADHTFNFLNPNSSSIDQVTTVVTTWFKETLQSESTTT